MRYSRQREQILKVVRSTDTHPAADWVYRRVRKRVPSISLGTVYRNLKQLVDGNLIQTLVLDGVAHYDRDLHDHEHFCCNRCGMVFDLDLHLEEVLSGWKTKLEHDVQRYELRVNGVCGTCRHNIRKGDVESCS
ncbi:MAG: transcriptional repressor [Candidatus Neomarinimicrobiota bacterium]